MMSRLVRSRNAPRHLALALAVVAAALLPTLVRADAGDDQYAVAAGLYSRSEWKLAAEEFETFLKEYPSHAQAAAVRFLLAEVRLQLKQYEEARKGFLQYLARAPDGQYARLALFRAGESAHLGQKRQAAEETLKRFVAKYPQDEFGAYAIPYLGNLAMAAKDYAGAAKYYRQALADYPDGQLQDDCRLGLGQALEQQGKNEEALRLFLGVAAKLGSPLADDAQFRLGALHYAMGHYEEAVADFQRLEKKFPSSPEVPAARLGRAWALLKLKRYDEAKSLLASLAADPKLGIDARYWLGMVQREQKDWAAAAQTLLAILETDPQTDLGSSIRFHAGDALLRADDVAGAVRQFDQVLAAAGGDSTWADDALRGKVQAAAKAKDHQQIDQFAEAFAKRFPKSPLRADVGREQARSLVQRKQYAEAAKLLEPIAGTGDGSASLEIRYLLGLAYQGLDRYDDALEQLAAVVKSAQGDLKADALLASALVRVDMGRFSDAVAPLEAFLATNPGPTEAAKARASLAVCYARSGQIEKAVGLLDKLRASKADPALLGPATRQVAEAAYTAGKWETSARLFGNPAAGQGKNKTQLRTLSGLGWSQFKGGDLAKAEATFGQLLDSDPPEDLAAEAALVRGEILDKLDRVDSALAMYDQVIDKYPKSKQYPLALVAAARLCHRLKQDRRAAKLYAERIEAEPAPADLDRLLYESAWVLYDLGRTKESQAAFERIHKQFPKSAFWSDATYRLARWAFEAQDYERAATLAAAVLQQTPESDVREHVLYLAGQNAAAAKKWERVRTAFETLLKEFPETPLRAQAEFWIAETYFRNKDYDTAGEKLNLLARQAQGRKDPWTAMIALRRAQVLAHQKKWAEAYLLASKITDKYPDFDQAYEVDYVLGRCLASRAEFDEARRAYRRVIDSPEGSKTETAAMAQWMIGESYFHQKDYEAALRAYLKVEILYAFPQWQAAALLQAAKCRELLGEWPKAVALYERLLGSYPNTPYTADAKDRLQKARQHMAGPKPGA